MWILWMFVFLQLFPVSYLFENNHIVSLRIDTYHIVWWPYRLIPYKHWCMYNVSKYWQTFHQIWKQPFVTLQFYKANKFIFIYNMLCSIEMGAERDQQLWVSDAAEHHCRQDLQWPQPVPGGECRLCNIMCCVLQCTSIVYGMYQYCGKTTYTDCFRSTTLNYEFR